MNMKKNYIAPVVEIAATEIDKFIMMGISDRTPEVDNPDNQFVQEDKDWNIWSDEE